MELKNNTKEGAQAPLVCIMGLGFVGAAMAVAVASAKDKDGKLLFNVMGVDLPDANGLKRIIAINEGRFPFESTDRDLADAIKIARKNGNLSATDNTSIYEKADIILVDINCDVRDLSSAPSLDMSAFRKAIKLLGQKMKVGSLIIVETTVPPGTCEKIVVSEIQNCLLERGLSSDAIMIAHSYERVMPGKDYYSSIVNFWRVYAGCTSQAAEACHSFLSKVINTKDFPLTRLSSTTASETAKVLENSYRAMTIAFMEEWGRYSEAVGIDMFEILQAIRVRPTHSNIRQPGFGVGGYCLTKDPLFAELAAAHLFNRPDLKFPFSTEAVKINNKMPLVSLGKIQEMLGGSLKDKNLLLMGISYREGVADSRHSPSEIFVREALSRGARVICHDALIKGWEGMDVKVSGELPSIEGLDGVIFAVQHTEYSKLDFEEWFKGKAVKVLDANNVLSDNQRKVLRKMGCEIASIGRGSGL